MFNVGDMKDKNIQMEGDGFRVRIHWFGQDEPVVLGLHETLRKAQAELLLYPRDCYEGPESPEELLTFLGKHRKHLGLIG